MSTVSIDLDAALGRFARQAQSLTLAGGAAIALTPDGEDSDNEMTCRASSGKDAPRVGARLRLVAGFKRECVREGKPVRCDDSETDTRVDRDRCRELGIRSVVAVPLKNNDSVVGVIEIFSTRTKAFTESHMAKLHVLAERVTDAVTGVEPVFVAPPSPAEPELLWADVFIESQLPWKRLLQSALCHAVLIAAVWNLTLNWAKSEKILSRSQPPSQLTYYPTPSFPAAQSHPPKAKAQAESAPKGGSPPPAPMVVKSGAGSSVPPKVEMPASGGMELAGLRTKMPIAAVADSPQRASLAAKGVLDAAPASIVAPPPQIARAFRRQAMAAPGSQVVAPSPTIDAPIRSMANAGMGSSKIVAPAPALPARAGVTGPDMGIGGVRAVVGPPPSMPLHEGSGGSVLTLGGGATVVGPPTALPQHEGAGGVRMSLGGGNGVVAPAPSVQGGLRQGPGGGGVTLGGGDAVVAPAPGMPGGARSNVMSAGLGGTGTVVGPPPGIPSGADGLSSADFGGNGMSVQPTAPSGNGTGGNGTGAGGAVAGTGAGSGSGTGTGAGAGAGSGAGAGVGSGAGAGSGSGSGPGVGAGAGAGSGSGSGGSGTALASAAVPAGSVPKTIRTSVPPQAPTHLDDPAGHILEVPVRVIGLALALPTSSFFSNYEVFIAEREFDKSEKRLIKLVYESRPTQRRLSDYGVSVATTYKLRVKRDPTCDESAAQITGGHYSEIQNTLSDPALRENDKDNVLPCYRTTADDYQRAASKKK